MSGSVYNSAPSSQIPQTALDAFLHGETQLSWAEKVERWPKKKRDQFFREFHAAGLLVALQYRWEFWARPNQLPPQQHWINWIIQAGRGFGKTRVGVEMVRAWKTVVPVIHCIAPTASDIHKVMLDGPAGFMKMCPPWDQPHFQTKDSTLVWKNGAKALMFSAEEPERLRGPQCYKLWADELPAWKYPDKTWDNAVLGLRLGDHPQAVITTTPRPIKLFKQLVKEAGTVVTRGATRDNMRNLSKRFLNEVVKKYQGTRLGRQELDGELLEDNPGALWTLDMIDQDRIDADYFWQEVFPQLSRIVTGVDPAVTSNADSDETGIVTVGADRQIPPHLYVFDDRSCIERPKGWAARAIAAHKQHAGDRIVAEVNNGGEMVEETIHNVDPNIPVTSVRASRGKITRAEPISALYEQHRVHHVGALPTLEDQMCDYDPALADYSPDRMDALVWACTNLIGSQNWLDQMVDEYIVAKKNGTAPRAPEARPQVQTQQEKDDMGLHKISTIGSLHKPEVSSKLGAQTTACPQCGNTGLARFADGAWKCGGCGASGRDDWQGLQVKKGLRQ